MKHTSSMYYMPSPPLYRALDPIMGDLRLINIHSSISSASEPLSCDLLNFSATSCPPYTALSYTWSDPFSSSSTGTQHHSILLNGHPFSVGSNLFSVLHQLRDRGTGFLWVDAICINQEDVREREIQVPRMKYIYTCAGNVIAWLGRSTNDETRGFKFLRLLLRIFKEPSPDSEILRLLAAEENLESWRAAQRLQQKKYWYRAWKTDVCLSAAEDCMNGWKWRNTLPGY